MSASKDRIDTKDDSEGVGLRTGTVPPPDVGLGVFVAEGVGSENAVVGGDIEVDGVEWVHRNLCFCLGRFFLLRFEVRWSW